MSKQYPLFSNGTEFMDWIGHNCDECRKGPTVGTLNGGGGGRNRKCRIETAIALEAAGILVSKAIHKILEPEGMLLRDCPEFEFPRPRPRYRLPGSQIIDVDGQQAFLKAD